MIIIIDEYEGRMLEKKEKKSDKLNIHDHNQFLK